MSLVLDGVAKSYPEFELGPVDLDVGNEVLAVLGPSGCGKTTLLSVVAGVVTPDAGRVSLDGVELTGRPPEDRGTVLVFQDGALFPHLTARENVAYAADSPDRVAELADTLEIEDVLDQPADTLSGGERQRVALARSLAADPDVLLCDEPLANLDAPIKRRLRRELRPLLSSLSIPVLYVTHDQREATALGDRLAVVENGRIHQVDSPEAVFARPATPFVASFTGSTNLFRADVVDTGAKTVLDWAGQAIRTPSTDHAVGTTVDFCIRPEYVGIADGAGAENVVAGTVTSHVFEGDQHLLTVAPEGGTTDVVRVRLSPPVYDGLGRSTGDRVRLSLPPEAIHVIGERSG
ncbi:ABC transporter ATP-binding protein [Halococcus salsus]|uniref:ABC transporter ATP-binding protein n=1 Tax=Halococcus salsus TaxID=2162894 RepID=UPI0013588292|nr:ABC transporter ATP-binding protein [Halococcus salsus]